MCILYADIVGSTVNVSKMEESAVRLYYRAFSNEITRVLNDFGGLTLKYGGDSVIGFFPATEKFVQAVDSTMQCGLTIPVVCSKSLSPYMDGKGMPLVQCRVGADFGEVNVMNLGVDGLYSTVDLVGNTMNVAAKICGSAGPNEFFVGQELLRLSYASYKPKCRQMGELNLREPYPYYRVEVELA